MNVENNDVGNLKFNTAIRKETILRNDFHRASRNIFTRGKVMPFEEKNLPDLDLAI